MTADFDSPRVLKRDLLAAVGPFVLLGLVLLGLAYWVLDPSPPRHVVLATGTVQGAYAEFGLRYVDVLARHGIKVELRPTQGSAENLALLRDPSSGVDLAFVQGGADRKFGPDEDPDAGLVSLGSLFYEPVWVFYREDAAHRILGDAKPDNLSQLKSFRINIGAKGSGVAVLIEKLFDANHLEPAQLELVRLSQTPAVVALLDGSVDAMAFVSAPESLMVQMLLQTPGIALMHFPQAEAYSRLFPFMSAVTLPRGVVDLERDMPPHDVNLFAPTGTLVARDSTHPALIQLFVQAAQEVHGSAGWFNEKGYFPNGRTTERPLAAEAERFYRSGVPFLQRYLPFWLANLIERMWPVLVTLIAVLLPLSRIVPPLYELRVRSRIFRWYGQLRELESNVGRRTADELARDLAALEERVEHISVPLAYADELYALRSHINLVRGRLKTGVTAA
ncbi:MAG: TAXI family TRAP transporter solute-binding subunit [Burkholderiales bacterium]